MREQARLRWMSRGIDGSLRRSNEGRPGCTFPSLSGSADARLFWISDCHSSKNHSAFFGSFSTRVFAIEHQIHAIDGELFRKTDDFFAPSVGHVIGHDGEGGDTEGIEVDDVVEAFDKDQPMPLHEFAVATFLLSAGVMAEEFLAAMEAFLEAVFNWCGSDRSFRKRKAGEVAFFPFVVWITSDPMQDFAVFRQNRVDDLASYAEATFVAVVHRQEADSPFCQRLRRQARMAADATRRCRWHFCNVDDELLIERRKFSDLFVVGVKQGTVAFNNRRSGRRRSLCGRQFGLCRRSSVVRVARKDFLHAMEFVTLEFVAAWFPPIELSVHERQQISPVLVSAGNQEVYRGWRITQ